MRDEQKIVDRLCIIMVVLAIIIAIASFKWISPLFILVSYLLIAIVIKIDNAQKYPYIVARRDLREANGKWKEKLVFFYSIKWLKRLYWYDTYHEKKWPVMWHFFDYTACNRKRREELLNKYFEQQD